ncbi:MAG: tetratricopeptide repeat protein [Thainema sp.]
MLILRKRHWLDWTEYILLLLTGIGTTLAVVLHNVVFAIAPLALLAGCNIANRQRFQQQALFQTRGRLANTEANLLQRLIQVETQVEDSPSSEAFHQFQQAIIHRNQHILEDAMHRVDDLQQQVNRCLWELEHFDLSHIHKETEHLQDRYSQMEWSIKQVYSRLHQIPAPSRLEHLEAVLTQLQMEAVQIRVGLESVSHEARNTIHPLQDQIDDLGLKLQWLIRTNDLTMVQQEVTEIIKSLTELVPKRDFMTLNHQLENLQLQQHDLQQAMVMLNEKLRMVDVVGAQSIQFDRLQAEIVQFQTQLDGLMQQAQLGTEQATVQTIMQQIAHHLPTALDMAALQQQVQVLSSRVDDTETELLNTKQQFAQTHRHQLLFDFASVINRGKADQSAQSSSDASHEMLQSILAQAQNQVLLVWPWLDQDGLDAGVIHQLEQLLERRVRVEIGWCHRGDRREGRWLAPIQQQWHTYPRHRQHLQSMLNQLLPLKQRYADRFRFKVLGTDENFLVCDRTFAVLGLHSILTQSAVIPNVGLKLQTTDPTVVRRLIQRFHHSRIDDQDAAAFFNRGVTHYDLGDQSRAIADFTQVIHLYPRDAVAYNNRGLAYYDSGHLAAALADLSQAIQCQPYQIVPYCNQGKIQMEQGNWAAALTSFEAAIEINPNSPIAWFYRGRIYQQQGHFSAAIADISRAIEQAPDKAFLYCYRSAIYHQMERLGDAIADLEQAVACLVAQQDEVNAARIQRTLNHLKQSRSLRPLSSVMSHAKPHIKSRSRVINS